MLHRSKNVTIQGLEISKMALIESLLGEKTVFISFSEVKTTQLVNEQDEILKTSTIDCGLSRWFNPLKAIGILTLKDLIEFPKENIRKIKNLGSKGRFYVLTVIESYWLAFEE